MKKYNVGILGATGMVGQKFVSLLNNHPWFSIKILAASEKSAGKKYKDAIEMNNILGDKISREIAEKVVFDATKDINKIANEVDFVFCAVNMDKEKIKQLEMEYAKLECPVISNNSAHRMTFDVPMIIPEINSHHAKVIEYQRKRLGTKRGFVAVKSNCSLQCYVPSAHPLIDLGIKKMLVCTYQSVSGAGKTLSGWEEMNDNIIPYIEGEEEKSEIEPLKIWGNLQNGKIQPASFPSITSQCLRVPVNNGHMAAVFMSFDKKASVLDIKNRWQNHNWDTDKLNLPSSPRKFLHYFEEKDRPQIKKDLMLENGMAVSVGRLREDRHYDIKFVCMSHNTVRGAAGGAVLTAELLCKMGYI